MNDAENLSKLLGHLPPAVFREFMVDEFSLAMPDLDTKKPKKEQREQMEAVLTALGVSERQRIEEVAERIVLLSDGAGQDVIDGELCDHYAFRQGNIDWQIWIATGSKPLPRKLVITNRSDEARPQSVQMFDWNLKPGFKDSVFKFTPPKGATAVELRSLEQK